MLIPKRALRVAQIAVASLTCSFASRGLALDSTPKVSESLTLRQALAYAREHQPSLKAAQARVAAAREAARVPRAAYFPRLGVTAQLFGGTENNTTASYVASPDLDIPRIGGTPANTPSTWAPAASSFAGVGLRQEVFDFGRISAQSAAADFLAVATEERARLERLDIELLVQETYFSVQAAKAVELASEGAFARAKAHSDLAGAGVRAGLRSPIELTRAEADLTRFDVARLRAAGGVVVAQSLFAAAIGSTDPLVDAAAEEIPYLPPPPLELMLRGLDNQDPAIRAAGAELQSQQQQTRAFDAELLPDLQLSAGVNGRAGGAAIPARVSPLGAGFLPDVPNWDVGLVLSWPLLDPVLVTRASVSRRQEGVRAAELDGVREAERTTVQRAYVEINIVSAALPALQRSFDASKANEAQAEARFKAGLGTSVELADAESLLTDAEIELAIGRFEQSRTRARLGRAVAEAVP